MNKFKTLSLLILLTFSASFVVAEVSMHDHKAKMESNLASMQKLLDTMKSSDEKSDIKDSMKAHSTLMKQGVKLSVDMADAKRKENKECMEHETTEDTESCYELETHTDMQYRLMVTLLSHVIDRQDLIMKKMGMLNSSHKMTHKHK